MVTRINGFSGMDVDSLVKSMMAVKRVPLEKVNQNKQILQWQRDDYREVNSKIYDFRNNKLSLTGYKNSESFTTQTAIMKDSAGKVVDASNSAIRATATANATGVAMEVSVKQLASGTTLEMDELGTGFTPSMSLSALAVKQKQPLVDADNKPVNFKLTLNQKTIEFPPETTLAAAVSQINSNADLNIKATFDEITGKLSFTSKNLGALLPDPANGATAEEIALVEAENKKRDIAVTEANNNFLKLFIKPAADPVKDADLKAHLEDSANKIKGNNASYVINGKELEGISNTVAYNGVSFTFQGLTGKWSGSVFTDNQPLTITTQIDSSKALQTVKTFINDYNSFVEDMNKRISQERYKDFPPLSADQRKELSESDIKAWEDKAKSGLIKNDPFVKNMLSTMRSAVGEQLGALSAMGITTGQYFENGKLYIDEAKFKKAVEANPQQVSDIFLGTAGNTDKSLLNKISVPMDTAISRISERAGTSKFSGSLTATFNSESVMGRQLKQYNSRISTLTTQLTAAETRYYKQFAAMESAMNKYNSQLSQLTGTAG